jgi:HD-like signal output (HDOD) protein
VPTAAPPDVKALVREAVRGVTALATLPEVTTQIIATVEDPKSSAGHLNKIISHDPSLSARILKVVNSAFYGVPGQVGSVERALVLLGMNAVKNLAVSASLGQLFRGAKLGEGYTAKDLWTHCISVGVCARELARKCGYPAHEEFFLAGLIHDVGILVELQTWPEKLQTVCSTVKKTGADFCETERQILGVDHQALGMGLAEHWRFTTPCQQAAGYHHNPSELPEGDHTFVNVIYVADTICCQVGKGFTLTARSRAIDPAVLSKLNLDEAAVQEMKTSLPEKLSAAMAIFS